MKHIIISIVALSLIGQNVFASADLQLMNQKTDELELADEIENIERFGEDAAAEETRKENARLINEAKRLEQDIIKANRAAEKAQKKSQRLSGLYEQKARLADRVLKRAQIAEAKKLEAERQAARLQVKVDAKEQKAILAIERRKAADKSYANLQREKMNLENRLMAANRVIKKNNAKRSKVRAQSLKLSQQNARMKKQVVKAENNARDI